MCINRCLPFLAASLPMEHVEQGLKNSPHSGPAVTICSATPLADDCVTILRILKQDLQGRQTMRGCSHTCLPPTCRFVGLTAHNTSTGCLPWSPTSPLPRCLTWRPPAGHTQQDLQEGPTRLTVQRRQPTLSIIACSTHVYAPRLHIYAPLNTRRDTTMQCT